MREDLGDEEFAKLFGFRRPQSHEEMCIDCVAVYPKEKRAEHKCPEFCSCGVRFDPLGHICWNLKSWDLPLYPLPSGDFLCRE